MASAVAARFCRPSLRSRRFCAPRFHSNAAVPRRDGCILFEKAPSASETSVASLRRRGDNISSAAALRRTASMPNSRSSRNSRGAPSSAFQPAFVLFTAASSNSRSARNSGEACFKRRHPSLCSRTTRNIISRSARNESKVCFGPLAYCFAMSRRWFRSSCLSRDDVRPLPKLGTPPPALTEPALNVVLHTTEGCPRAAGPGSVSVVDISGCGSIAGYEAPSSPWFTGEGSPARRLGVRGGLCEHS
mmetsp:Transcript_12299/g.35368  ORF Transcript_12299/g.35368 Transcript_12299/m.35368 type:complete len:246 (+) Transcript_12299:1279-2016(+)